MGKGRGTDVGQSRRKIEKGGGSHARYEQSRSLGWGLGGDIEKCTVMETPRFNPPR